MQQPVTPFSSTSLGFFKVGSPVRFQAIGKTPRIFQNHCGTQRSQTAVIDSASGKKYISIAYRMKALNDFPPSEKTAYNQIRGACATSAAHTALLG